MGLAGRRASGAYDSHAWLAGQRAEPASDARSRHPRRSPAQIRWARLLARGHCAKRGREVLPLLCPSCGREMRILAFLTEPVTVRTILVHLELPHRPLPSPRPAARRSTTSSWTRRPRSTSPLPSPFPNSSSTSRCPRSSTTETARAVRPYRSSLSTAAIFPPIEASPRPLPSSRAPRRLPSLTARIHLPRRPLEFDR